MRSAALRADSRLLFRDNGLTAIIAVVSGNPVSPPELAADAPVADVVGPVEIGLLHPGRDQLDVALFHALYRGFDELVHLHEPLLFDQRLDSGTAAVVCTNVVDMVFDTDQKAHLIQFFDDLRPGFISVHAAELRAILVNRGVVVHDIDLRQIVALADFEVVGVMCGCDLDDAGAEFPVDILVRYDRDLPVNKRKPHIAADQVFISVILGMDCHSGIAEHRLRTGSCKLKECRLRN